MKSRRHCRYDAIDTSSSHRTQNTELRQRNEEDRSANITANDDRQHIAIVRRNNRCCSASDSAYSYTFLRSVVCLSVVCHISAPCLNRLPDLDAVWRVHLQGPMTHCVRWERGLWAPGKGRFEGSNPQPKRAFANCGQTINSANTNEELSGLATAIPHFAKLLWSLLCIRIYCRT